MLISLFSRLTRRYFIKITLNQYDINSGLDFHYKDSYKEFLFREIVAKDFYNNSVFYKKNRKDRYLKHLKQGHRCFGFETTDGDIAAYFWLTLGQATNPPPNPAFKHCSWLLNKNEAYIWDCRTIEDYRRQGLYKAGLQRISQFCRKLNKEKIMISCEIPNHASNEGIVSAGFILQGRSYFIAFGPFKIVWCTHKRKRLSKLSSPVTTREVFPASV